MNIRDSEVVCGLLRKRGFELVNSATGADIVIFNTCSVRQRAEEKVWSYVGDYKDSRGANPIIGIIGCMAANYKAEIFQHAPRVDFVVGPADISKIPAIISTLISERVSLKTGKKTGLDKICQTDSLLRPEDIYHTGFYLDKQHAYVVISEGCSNYCSYCVVPFVRGHLRSRNYKDILLEIEEALSSGITKITLLGQNVNAYNCKGANFVKLLKLIGKTKGLKEFSFVTSHPKDTTEKLFRTIASIDKLKKDLHLPIQSGSDRILKLMKRGYTRSEYLGLAKSYRKIVKGGTLTTDIIVGFPTEKKEDFLDTYNLIKEIRFNRAFIFKYSPRPHTEAAKARDDVEKKEKEERHRAVLDLQRDISRKKKCAEA